jgi:hypothetical protein
MSRGIARCVGFRLTKRALQVCLSGGGGHRDAILKAPVEPEHKEAMRAALKKVCVTLGLKRDVDDRMTAGILDKIVAHAKAGEHDADRLAELVLNALVDDGRAAAS